MIKPLDKLPPVNKGTKIRAFADELQNFIGSGVPIGEYVVANAEDKASIYTGLRNAVKQYGLDETIEVVQRSGAICIRRLDAEEQ